MQDVSELVVYSTNLLAGWACRIHSMARYSVESTMPAALPACQGLPPSSSGLDAACPEAGLPPPASCTSAGQSKLAVPEGKTYIQLQQELVVIIARDMCSYDTHLLLCTAQPVVYVLKERLRLRQGVNCFLQPTYSGSNNLRYQNQYWGHVQSL